LAAIRAAFGWDPPNLSVLPPVVIEPVLVTRHWPARGRSMTVTMTVTVHGNRRRPARPRYGRPGLISAASVGR
jgi:hypothetical protein